MITALDHIAIAVPDLEKAITRFLDDFGLQHDGNEVVEAAQTTTAFFSLPPRISNWCIRWTAGVRSRVISISEVEAYTICAFGLTTSMAMSRAFVTRGINLPAMPRPPAPMVLESFLSIPRAVTAC